MDNEKGIRIPISRAKDLKVRTVKSGRARRVKGGPINDPDDARNATTTSALLPAVQRLDS